MDIVDNLVGRKAIIVEMKKTQRMVCVDFKHSYLVRMLRWFARIIILYF